MNNARNEIEQIYADTHSEPPPKFDSKHLYALIGAYRL